MGGGNPMNVDKYSYKTEFQARGAGHIHGTIWVKIHVIEELRRLGNGTLITKKKYKEKKYGRVIQKTIQRNNRSIQQI